MARFQPFLEWFRNNGGLIHPSLELSDCGGSSRCLAKEPLSARTAVVSVPRQLIICTQLCRASDLAPFFRKFKGLFAGDNEDSEYNMVACFLARQRLRGKDSFWWPYFSSIGPTHNMIFWDEEILSADSRRLVQEALHFKQDVSRYLGHLFSAARSQPLLMLAGEDALWQALSWAYSVVLTRCFGYSTPSIYLVPMADLFNHSHNSGEHFLVSPGLELQPVPGYKSKNKRWNLTLLGLSPLSSPPPPQLPCDYEEDNDSADSEDQRQEQLFCRDRELDGLQQIYIYEQGLSEGQTPDIPVSQLGDVESLERKEEQEHPLGSEEEQRQREQIIEQFRQRQVVKEGVAEGPVCGEDEEEDEDEKFGWVSKAEDLSFVVTTGHEVKPGEEVHVCYGRRTNQFLLMWYGFSYRDNAYDSVGFRLRAFPRGTSLDERLQDMLYQGYYGGLGLLRGLPHRGVKLQKDQLTREFRLKRAAFPFALLEFTRLFLMGQYRGPDLYRLQVTIPVSLTFEQQALFVVLSLLHRKQASFATTIAEDEGALAKLSPGRVYFCVLFRLEQKLILSQNVRLVQQAQQQLASFGEDLDYDPKGDYGATLSRARKYFKEWRRIRSGP